MQLTVFQNRSVNLFAARLLLAAIVLLAVSLPATSMPQPTSPTFDLRSRESIRSANEIPFSQEDGWAGIKTNEGLLFVWNVGELYFTLSINGKTVKPLDDPEHIFFLVDGRVLQIQVATIASFAPDAREKKLDDRAILAAHRAWEANFVEGLLKSKLAVQTFNAKLSSGGEASMWQFDMPESLNAEAKKQLYLTIVRKDYVVLLNSEATATMSDAEGRKFLLDTIATLKLSPTRIDVNKLSESISKGVAP